MATHFDGMSHEAIYQVVHVGAPGTVSGAASQLDRLNKTITGHLDALDKLSSSMTDAWPDENGHNFRTTLGHTVTYLRELQANHVVTASSSITQVMSASHEKLQQTQSTMPTPPAIPLASQEKTFNQHVTANNGAMNTGTATESQHISQAKADDAKAVLLAKSLANTYASEKAKLTAPPTAPKGPAGTGSGASVAVGTGQGVTSNHAMAGYHGSAGHGGSAASLVGGGVSGGAGDGHGSHGITFAPVHHGGDPGSTNGGGGLYGATGGIGQPGTSGHGGTLLDPKGPAHPLYDANGNLIGGSGLDGQGGSAVSGVLGASRVDGHGSGLNGGVLGIAGVGGGLAAAGVIAARRQAAQNAAQQAALLKAQLADEQLGAGGAGGAGGTGGAGGNLSASQLAAINAQRNGILAAGERAGMMSGERTMLSAQQRTMLSTNTAMTAQEEAQLAAGQRMVPGQLGGSTATAAAGAARGGMPFAGGGVVGGAERVTWLVEDRDLFSADAGVRAIIED